MNKIPSEELHDPTIELTYRAEECHKHFIHGSLLRIRRLFVKRGNNEKIKYAKLSRKNEYFLPPDMHTYVCASGGKKCSFFG